MVWVVEVVGSGEGKNKISVKCVVAVLHFVVVVIAVVVFDCGLLLSCCPDARLIMLVDCF